MAEFPTPLRGAALALVILAATSTPALASPPTFAPSEAFEVGDDPSALATGDFNGDGHVDLVTANRAADAVSVLAGPSFTVRTDHAVGDSPQALVAADLDEDGRDDLAVVNTGSDRVTIFLGSADGLVDVGYASTRPSPVGIAAGDLNGDAHADLAVVTAGQAGGTVDVIMGNGEGGGWYLRADAGCGANDVPKSVAVGRFTNDAAPDLAVLCAASSKLVTLAGDGAWRLTAASVSDGHCGSAGNSLTLGELDRDSRADAIVTCNNRRFVVFEGNSGFTFKRRGPDENPWFTAHGLNGGWLAGATSADLDGDDIEDVAVAHANILGDSVVVAHNTGAEMLPVSAGSEVGTRIAIAGRPSAIVAADLDDDGRIDLATALAGTDRVAILRNITPIPGVTTGRPTAVAPTGAVVAGTVDPNGSIATYSIEYGTGAGYGERTPELPSGGGLDGSDPRPVSAELRGLRPETTYHYRLVARNGNGKTYGPDRTFRTPPAPPVNRSAPAISGTAAPGGDLACDPGSWDGDPAFEYAWLRNGVTIDGATAARYTAITADAGTAIQCRVAGTTAGGTAVAASAPVVVQNPQSPQSQNETPTDAVPVCAVPRSLRGLKLRVARARLRAAGCAPGRVTSTWSRVRRGRVIRTTPAAGQRRQHGAVVGIVVSRGRR